MTTYGNSPGVKVQTTSKEPLRQPGEDMSEYEYQLCLIILLSMVFEDEHPSGKPVAGIDMNGAESALQCYGYSQYEAMPMLWSTLEHVGEEYLDG